MQYTNSHYFKAVDEYKIKKYRNTINEINLYLKEDKRNGIDEKGLFILAKSYFAIGMKIEKKIKGVSSHDENGSGESR